MPEPRHWSASDRSGNVFARQDAGYWTVERWLGDRREFRRLTSDTRALALTTAIEWARQAAVVAWLVKDDGTLSLLFDRDDPDRRFRRGASPR